MKSRQEYLADKISHRDYYAQFITTGMIEQVKNKIGVDRIKASKDEHLNDIPLKLWDSLSGCIFRGSQLIAKPFVTHKFTELLKQADEGVSPATLVCVYKEIARQLAEGKLN